MNVVAIEETTLEEVASQSESETVIVTKNGKPLLSVQRLSKDDLERMALARNPKFIAIIEESRRSLCEHGGLTMAEVCKKHGLRNPAESSKRPRRPKTVASKPPR